MLITNATLITWGSPNRLYEKYALHIEGALVREIGPEADLLARYPDEEKLNAHGQLVMPGNICAHTHFYGAFARGLAVPGNPPQEFKQILEGLWWPLDKSLDEDGIRYSALTCLVDAVKYGTTTLFDYHASPNFIDGSLDIIAEVVEQAGLRAVLCYEVTDRDGKDKARAGIAENVRFLKRTKGPLLAGTFGLHAPLTLSTATLEESRAAAPDGTGFHIHVSESQDDGYAMFENDLGAAWPIDWLNKHDILGQRTIIAHAVHVDEYEMDQLAETGTWVTHQPRSNMNNGVGVAKVEEMLKMGMRVCLGNDGFSHPMWDEWKAASLLQKNEHRDPRRMNGNDVVQMAVYNNAALANVFFSDAPLGQIVPGGYADLIFVEYHATTPLTADNLPWHILFGFQGGMVTTTIIHGRVLMRDRELLTLDEAEIAAKAREAAVKTWKRYNAQF
ncbi:MAG: putative aminohydrolase SsnA [Chloroflexi bacterium]|nr:putative aminohydrolase SsnA [Chloroflexota bacterium]